tara:strand:+ start:23 stop:307 length:285 start_codon:yes stop_codon:yes gene_type:complete
MKVQNMTSNKGNKIANQFIIKDDHNVEYFQSYDSIIVRRITKPLHTIIQLDENFWDYSVTTGKYRNIFLNETKKETQKKINLGIYELQDLNDRG